MKRLINKIVLFNNLFILGMGIINDFKRRSFNSYTFAFNENIFKRMMRGFNNDLIFFNQIYFDNIQGISKGVISFKEIKKKKSAFGTQSFFLSIEF